MLLFILLTLSGSNTIFDFNERADLRYWQIVDDVVMGGRSNGQFSLNPEGHGLFHGAVSLENNGGFSSVRYSFNRIDVRDKKSIVLRVKGDGKSYQFRIKDDRYNYYSYITTFTTNKEWQEIEVPLNSLYPAFRGRELNMANFSKDSIEELAILIGNKRPEEFMLLIDHISLK